MVSSASGRKNPKPRKDNPEMIRIIAAGKIKDSRLSGLIGDYLKRIRPMASVEIVEIKDSKPEKEAKDMVTRLGSAGGPGLVLAMDEHGKDLTSVDFSRLMLIWADGMMDHLKNLKRSMKLAARASAL